MKTIHKSYDVVICGAGMAGLTLARQLSMQVPDLSILMIDRLQRPLPTAAHKVGESTVHPGGTYLCNVLNLKEYLDTNHIEKYGLRYFYRSDREFSQRPELGRSVYDEAILEHQLDRGIFENDLREMAVEAGVELVEGTVIKSFELGEGEELHSVTFKGLEAAEENTVTAKWLIDATGRFQMLSRKLGLKKEFPTNCSATWMRVKGRYDVGDLVPKENAEWQDRVSREHPFLSPEDFSRYNSTNHIMGYGYWIWVIPLVSGYTSIGVVTNNDYHNFAERKTQQKTMDWLWKHDPAVAKQLENFEVLDFRAMPNYSHSATQVFSENRWACTGEAGVFSDPFQSPGTDSIAVSNCYITELIKSDRQGKLSKELVDSINAEYLDYTKTLTGMIHASYPAFYNEGVGTISVMWYLAWTMSYVVPNMRFRAYPNGHIAEQGALSKEDWAAVQEINRLGLKVSEFIRDWATERRKMDKPVGYLWMNHWHVPFFGDFRTRFLTQKEPEWRGNLQKMKEFAAAIFHLATEEMYPKEYHKLPADFVPNVMGMSMNLGKWEEDGLYDGDAEVSFNDCDRVKSDLLRAFFNPEPALTA